MSRRTDELYIHDIVESIEHIESFIHGLTFDTFSRDAKSIHAVVRCIEIIGEASVHVSEEYRKSHALILWKRMIGMRNKMIHEYFGINMEHVWNTIEEDLPSLKEKIRSLLDDQ